MSKDLSYQDEAHIFYIELSIISLRNYWNLVENNLAENHKLLLIKYQTIAKKYQEENYQGEDLDYFYRSASQSLNEVEIGYSQRFRFSIIIQLYSFIEDELKKYCDNHYNVNSKEYRINDLKGNNDLDKIKKYLTQSAGKAIGENLLWPFINDLRKLRNCIVHSNGVISETDSDYNSLKKFSKNNFIISENNYDDFKIVLKEKEFIELCINNVQTFLKSVII